ncbi:MAG: DMT family transporter [Candidatus Nanoarchaeia archaeon]|nr:DMT family transporter [Candidatus Nanoarchaeia archaeon]
MKKWLTYAILGMMTNGITLFFAKVILSSSGTYSLVFMQFLGGFLCVSAYIFIKKIWKSMDLKEILLASTCGAFSSLGVTFFYLALNDTLVSVVAPIRGSGFLIFTSLLGFIFLKEKITPKKLIGLILAILAIIFLTI